MIALALPYWGGGDDRAFLDDGEARGDRHPAGDRESAEHVIDDAVLAERVRAGDVSAFEMVFTRYAGALATFAYRFTRSAEQSQDVVHDVFVRVWEHRVTFAAHGSVRGYLYAAVRNRAMHGVEHASVEARAAEAFLAADASPTLSGGTIEAAEGPEVALLRAEMLAQVRAALATLPPRARLIAVLRWQDGLSRSEVGEALGIAVGTVNKQLTLAALALRARLAPLDG